MRSLIASAGLSSADCVEKSELRARSALALERLAPALAWAEVDHHATHATLAAFDAPWPRSVVATYDAGGNDGCFNIYRAARRRGSR